MVLQEAAKLCAGYAGTKITPESLAVELLGNARGAEPEGRDLELDWDSALALQVDGWKMAKSTEAKSTEAKEWAHLGGQEMLLEVSEIIGALTPMSQEETIMEIVKELGRLRDPDVMVHECDLDDMGPGPE
jgi:hypothetical protein